MRGNPIELRATNLPLSNRKSLATASTGSRTVDALIIAISPPNSPMWPLYLSAKTTLAASKPWTPWEMNGPASNWCWRQEWEFHAALPGSRDGWGEAMSRSPRASFSSHYLTHPATTLSSATASKQQRLPSGVLTIPSMTTAFAHHVAYLTNQFAKGTIISINESESLARNIQALAAPRATFHLHSRPIARLTTTDPAANITITFTTGGEAHHAFLVHTPKKVPTIDFANGLGLELTEVGTEVKTLLPFYESSLKGCFAVGDRVYALTSVVLGVAAGAISGAGIVGQIWVADYGLATLGRCFILGAHFELLGLSFWCF